MQKKNLVEVVKPRKDAIVIPQIKKYVNVAVFLEIAEKQSIIRHKPIIISDFFVFFFCLNTLIIILNGLKVAF